MHTVSIVIPVYNGQSLIARCLDSILKQTYQNFQIIAVDDGSTDSTRSILDEYARKDSRIQAVTITHGGVSKARNAGLALATGEYLQFTDADDTLDERFLEKMVGLMQANDAELAVCRFSHPFFQTYITDGVYDLTDERQLLDFYQDTFALVMPWNKVWKRTCFTQPFDESVHFSEDELGNLANLCNVKKAVTTGEYLYCYYFANEAPDSSCVNQIIHQEAFWENHTSFYYKGALLLQKRRNYIQTAIDEGKLSVSCADDMAYTRLLDYAFWQMPAYIGMGVPEEALAVEYGYVFRDTDFVRGFAVQEKFGFRIPALSEEEVIMRAKKYTSLCYKTYAERANDGNFRVAYAFIMIYLKLFAEKTGELDPVNYNARMLLQLEDSSTPEAVYVNGIL